MATVTMEAKGTTPVQRETISFPLSLAGGVLILLGGASNTAWMGTMMGEYDGMMGMMQGMMASFGFGMMANAFVLSLASGMIVLVGAIMLRMKPQQRSAWGTAIIIFSALSILGMGSFLIGALLGIIGGALALA